MTEDPGQECAQALANLRRYLDCELPPADLASIAAHLGDCPPCADRASFEAQVRALVRRGCADAAPTSLVHRVRMTLTQYRT